MNGSLALVLLIAAALMFWRVKSLDGPDFRTARVCIYSLATFCALSGILLGLIQIDIISIYSPFGAPEGSVGFYDENSSARDSKITACALAPAFVDKSAMHCDNALKSKKKSDSAALQRQMSTIH